MIILPTQIRIAHPKNHEIRTAMPQRGVTTTRRLRQEGDLLRPALSRFWTLREKTVKERVATKKARPVAEALTTSVAWPQ